MNVRHVDDSDSKSMLAGQTLTKLYVWPHMTLCRKREEHYMRSLCLGDQHAALNLHL